MNNSSKLQNLQEHPQRVSYLHCDKLSGCIIGASLSEPHTSGTALQEVHVYVWCQERSDVQVCHQRLSSAFDLLLIFVL